MMRPRLGKTDGKSLLPFEAFQTEMADLLDRASKLCPVLFVGMIPVDESKMPFLDCLYYNHADQIRYNDAIRSMCQARQIPHLNLLETWRSRGLNLVQSTVDRRWFASECQRLSGIIRRHFELGCVFGGGLKHDGISCRNRKSW